MIICTSGHRPKYFSEYPDVAARLLDTAAHALTEHPVEKVVCGMASGWDLALGSVAYALGIPLICARPWPAHKPNYGDGGRYQKLLMYAKDVIDVTDGTVNFNHAFEARNRWMVDHSDHVFALYRGLPSGTQRCLAYAAKQGKPATNFWEVFKSL